MKRIWKRRRGYGRDEMEKEGEERRIWKRGDGGRIDGRTGREGE